MASLTSLLGIVAVIGAVAAAVTPREHRGSVVVGVVVLAALTLIAWIVMMTMALGG